MSKRDRISFSEYYIYEFFDHVREKTRTTYDQENYVVIDELFTLLSEQDEITEGIGKLAQEQASGELSIFLFDIFDRAQDYPPTELVDALPEIADDFVSGLSIMLEEEETLHSIKLVNNLLKGSVPEEVVPEEAKEEIKDEPAPEIQPEKDLEEETHSFTQYIEKSFISELQTALLVQASQEDTDLYISFTTLLLENLDKPVEGEIPEKVEELMNHLHTVYPWISGKPYSPSQLMSDFKDTIDSYTSLIVELDNDFLEHSVNESSITLQAEEETQFEQEEVPEQPTTIDNLLSEYFQSEVDEYISSLKKIFKAMEKTPDNKDHLKHLVEKFQSFKEINMIHGYVKLEDFCSDMISLLNQAKKDNNSYNPETKDSVKELLSILQKTDKFKDAKTDTEESTQLNALLEGFTTTLFIASSAPSEKEIDIEPKVEEEAEQELEESLDEEETVDEIKGTDRSSLIDVFKSLLKDVEPIIKEEISTDKPVSDKLTDLLSRLLNASKLIDQPEIILCLEEYLTCSSVINQIDDNKFKAAGKELIKIFSEISKIVSNDFKFDKLEKKLTKFKEKYISDILEIPFKDTDKLLSVLMEIEQMNADDFVNHINLVVHENNLEVKDIQKKHFERLSTNLEILGASKFSEFPTFYLSLLEEPPDTAPGKDIIEKLGASYQSIIQLISEKGLSADIETDLNSARVSLSQKEEIIESLVEEDLISEPESSETIGDEAKIPDVSEEEDLDEIFKQESENYLNAINEALTKLDANLDEKEAYESIEKSLHSLKSSARLMGYSELADISSPFEEIFEVLHSTNQRLKADDLKVIKEVVDGLSSGVKGESVDSTALIEKLNSIEVSKPSEAVEDKDDAVKEEQLFAGSTDEDEDLLDIFKDESAEYINIVEKATETLATKPQDQDALGQLEHAMHSLKTAAKMLGFSEIGQIADSVEMVSVEIQKGGISSTQHVNMSVKSAIELIKELTSGQKKGNEEVETVISGLDIANLKKGDSAPKKDQTSEKSEKKPEERDEQTEMFIKEGWELLEKINRDLVILEKDPKDQSVLDNLNRTIHTLKGSAQILNFQHIGTLAHKIEDLFAKSKESKQGLSENSMDLTFKAVDTIQDLLNSIKRGKEEKGSDANLIVKQIEELLEKSDTKPPAGELVDKPVVPQTKPKVIPVDKIKNAQKDVDQVIKITTETLDNLVNMAAELVINKTQLSAYLDKLREIGETLDEDKKTLRKTSRTISSFLEKTFGDDTSVKFKEEIDKNIMDDLVSVSDDFNEVMNTYDTVSRSFRTITQEFEQNIGQISTLTKSLHDDILQVRMVPTEMLFNRFPRAVRDMAKKLKKKVTLVVEGEKTEMDRALIETLTDPVMHLVRNAIDHGIETPKERKANGKSEDGIILLKAKRSKNQILIEVQDDGSGIDPEVVKNVIVKKNLASKEELEEMSPSEIMSFVFDPGFSTRDEASDVSGRGVGLDVVSNQLQKLKGDIRIKSTPGLGTIFNIRVPLTLAIAQAMLVKVDSETLAIPLAAVEETVQFKDPELVEQDEKAFITVRDQLLPVAYLSALLNYRTGKKSARSKSNTAIIVQESGARYGLIVDNVLRREEIVIKSLGEHLAHVPFISGGTIYGDGSVGLILDIPSITQKIESDVHTPDKDFSDIERAREIVTEESKRSPAKKESTIEEPVSKVEVLVKKKKVRGRAPKALIVDDSVSVRKFVSSVLEKNKYATVLTEDGPDALEKLRKEKFDIIITDLEMPKMHGFDLIQEIRSYKKYQSIPIVILTGRAGKKHKDKGKELGANAYITKPFKENDLLKSLEDFIEIV
jgi:chemosensory pili system protein ChpA (sensor histidine kinase/response regulator)